MPRFAHYVVAALLAAAAPLLASDASAQQAPAAGQPQPASPEATAQTIAKVQAFYDSTTSFVSPFNQEFWVKSHNVRKKSKGKVTFAKPGKMAWDYEDPAGNRVVSDGSILKVYEAGNKQMFEQNVDKSQYPAALSFLTGTGKLTDSFSFVMYPGEAMDFRGGMVLVGTPKKENAAYTKVLFYVDTATHHIRRALIVDAQGNRNRFDFVEPKVNVQVDDGTFKLVPPPGTQIIKP
ncbi:MAG TPA: outer membrane lipoprotein carrier protein LolA [Labilithrix sp.]|jgi:outer membrane lipoprotein carrier protein|nr:outer membrane lipoprotein carrier protein LolA [Labilithrix sp.]